MKILVVSQYFYPEQFRVNDICRELVSRGHQVSVVTGLPNYPDGEIYSEYEHAWQNVSEYYGARVYRCKLRPRHKGAINLVRNYLSFVLQAKMVLKQLSPDFDVIYIYEPSPVTVALPAIWFKKKYGIPIYYYCLDIWPECVRDLSSDRKVMSTKHPIYIVAKCVSRYVYNHVDIIANKCEDFADYIATVCRISPSKMKVLYEHAEDTYLSVNAHPEKNGVIDFMFMGNIGSAQNCETIVRALKKVKSDTPYKLHFVGGGSSLESLKKMVSDEQLSDKVVFHGRFPVSEMHRFYNLADVCMLTLSNTTAVGLTPPAKLMGYMAASRPILGAINGASQRIIRDANCGFTTDYDDVDGLAEYMQRIVDDPRILNGLGENGRNYFLNHFTLEKHMSTLEKQLKDLIGENEK